MNKSIIPITEPKPIADCKILNVPISEFNINLGQSRTDKFIYINIEKTNANEIRLIDAANPKAEPKIAIVRGEDHLYSLEHANDDSFYVRSNLNSPNYKIYKASNIDTLNVSLEEVAPHNPNIFISDHIIFDEYLILEIRENADVQQRVLRMSFTQEVKEAGEFWKKLEYEVDLLVNSEDKKLKEIRTSAYRVQDIIEDAQRRFDDILDPEIGNPMDYIKEGCTNIINISELSEKQ